ncbi:MAG: putative hydrolase or acyltransferase of alpha/beta superfamily [Planctomycetota bacterium]|nr:putative hydrolase or acyltransferase of alpha/beta superfamily [Planctomycetota bacterium]
MRLAIRHREMWLGLDDCGISEVQRVPGRFGSFETVRMGHGEAIVLIPGLAGGWRLLAPLARLLAKRHEVVMVGLRGDQDAGGISKGQRPCDHAFDVADVIGRLGLERPTVMGVSFGAAVALEMAVEYPKAVGALILSGGEACFRPSLGAAILLRALERFPLPHDSAFLNQFFNVLHGRRPEPGALTDFVVRRCWETDQGVVAARLRGLDGFDLSERLWEIDAPALVLAGTKDVAVPLPRQRSLAETIPFAQFASIEGAGHVGFLTHHAEFATQIGQFVHESQASYC